MTELKKDVTYATTDNALKWF